MKDKIIMVIFVLVLGTILSSALVGVNSFTKPIIEKNESLKLKSNVLDALNLDYDELNIEERFAAGVKEMPYDERTVFYSAGGDVALPYGGAGLWGPITGIIAMTSDLSEIKGITIMHQEETPGLGSRIAHAAYLGQFIGKEFSPELQLMTPGKADENNEIDGISGATMSSKAFVDILNSEYGIYRDLLKEGGQQ